MPLIPKVGRRSPPVLAAILFVFAVLIAGGITMVYPFLLMVAAAMANDYDYERYRVFPTYVFRQDEQFLKYLADKYVVQSFPLFASVYEPPAAWASLRDLARARPAYAQTVDAYREGLTAQARLRARDLSDFIARLPADRVQLVFLRLRENDYQAFVREKYTRLVRERSGGQPPADGNLEQAALRLMNDLEAEARFTAFDQLWLKRFIRAPFHLQKWFPERTPRWVTYFEFIRSCRPAWLAPVTGKYLWNLFLFKELGSIQAANARWGTAYASLWEVPFFLTEAQVPAGVRPTWEHFLRTTWPLRLVRLSPACEARYRSYLQRRCGRLERYNRLVEGAYRSWQAVPWNDGAAPERALERPFWMDFVEAEVGLEDRRLDSVEARYVAFLQARYGSLERLRAAHGVGWTAWEEVRPLWRTLDAVDFLENRGSYVQLFLTHNFAEVFRFVATRGVALRIAGALVVNPLAAYALARFRVRGAYAILLVLLATMAFPPEVAMIPSFLLLRDLGLLNTFAALVLPTLASGFSIFLLKGFFESQPRELYEAAMIDGAGEWRLFRSITLPLAKPVLAVTALGAFVQAYGGFMWAFVVCREESMWTLTVWLYQFQQRFQAYPYMVMAALVLASVPTLVVFLFCQRIILRGIVIPSMK